MFYVWAEYAIAPVSLVDAGSTVFDDDATEADFAEYAESRGFTEDNCHEDHRVWRNPADRSFIALLGAEGDSAVALRIANYVKLAGRIGDN